MSYLAPPPNMSPVVVVKDYGGYVDQYAARTEEYRRTNREVRIHECHSACTMALSLPNVCVYPDSVFKFHQAYDPRNHITNWSASDALFHTYPVAVRERLGTLTKNFTVLRGAELIELGIRDCGEPQPRIMIAQAKLRSLPETTTAGGTMLATLTGKLEGMIPSFGTQPERGLIPDKPRPQRVAPDLPDEILQAKVPLPPERPTGLEEAKLDTPAEVDVTPTGGIPLPPRRPKLLIVAYTPSLPPMPMLRMIDGSQTILPAHFVPFPRNAT